MKWSQITDVGRVRQHNEDSIGVFPEIGLFLVADGMGGHSAGEVASAMAVKIIGQHLSAFRGLKKAGPINDILSDGLIKANGAIYKASRDNPELRGMGTTLTAAMVLGQEAFICHVGDSRAYQIRAGSIRQLTLDHSLVQELVRVGGITQVEARQHPQRNVLTRALGTAPGVEVDSFSSPIKKGDLLLLCSDGLTGPLEDSDILKIILESASLDGAAKDLLGEALNRGGLDNISVLLVECDG